MLVPTLSWVDLMASEKDRERMRRRYPRLLLTGRYIDKAALSLKRQGRKWPTSVRVRQRFIYREEPPTVEASDRTLPPLAERPPATRLLKAGLALRFYLIALCATQMQTRRGNPRNGLRLMSAGDDIGWIDLVAVPVEDQMAGEFAATRATKKQRQVTSALKTLSGAGLELVHLPNEGKRYNKYERFQLLDEGGVRAVGEVPPYTVPTGSDRTFALPPGLFSNGWIHLLENSELAFLMMLAAVTQQARQGEWVKIPAEQRLLHFGIGPDTYEAFHALNAFGLLDYEVDEARHMDGKVKGYGTGTQLRLHAFKLLPDGFEEPAFEVMKECLEPFVNRQAR